MAGCQMVLTSVAQVGMVRPYSTPDALEGLLQLVRTDHNIAPTQEFRRLINLPGNRRAAATR